jgi:tetraacyldisaccharide 4'-kinase
VVRVRHRSAALVDPQGREHPPEALARREVIALAGLARPSGFLQTLRELGMQLHAQHLFPDHHPYRRDELPRGPHPVVTTEKDRQRLPPDYPVWQVRQAVEVLEGEPHLLERLGF